MTIFADELKLDPCFTTYTKINCRYIRDLSVSEKQFLFLQHLFNEFLFKLFNLFFNRYFVHMFKTQNYLKRMSSFHSGHLSPYSLETGNNNLFCINPFKDNFNGLKNKFRGHSSWGTSLLRFPFAWQRNKATRSFSTVKKKKKASTNRYTQQEKNVNIFEKCIDGFFCDLWIGMLFQTRHQKKHKLWKTDKFGTKLETCSREQVP